MDAERERWRNLIGEFMLEFAEAEVDVLQIFADFAHPGAYETARATSFERRAKRARKVIRDKVADPLVQKIVLDQLAELVWLSGNGRNLVAHNPLEMALEYTLKGLEVGEIRSFRDSSRFLTFQKLQKYLERTRASRDQLNRALMRARSKLPVDV
jgi:hypothetical protein